MHAAAAQLLFGQVSQEPPPCPALALFRASSVALTELCFLSPRASKAGSMPPPAAQGRATAAVPPRQRQRAIFHPQSAGQNTRGAKHETERLSSPLLSSPLNRGSTTSCALRARLRPSAPPSSSSMR
ncbi:hypothetical protein ZWY2020_014167 [Hordeum vulgare]|nr:hypothetical protein ZWY2020_014167 [Hordeum vulgare]